MIMMTITWWQLHDENYMMTITWWQLHNENYMMIIKMMTITTMMMKTIIPQSVSDCEEGEKWWQQQCNDGDEEVDNDHDNEHADKYHLDHTSECEKRWRGCKVMTTTMMVMMMTFIWW